MLAKHFEVIFTPMQKKEFKKYIIVRVIAEEKKDTDTKIKGKDFFFFFFYGEFRQNPVRKPKQLQHNTTKHRLNIP